MEKTLRVNEEAIDWSLCTWEGARREQHRRYNQLSFRKKMESLEEMCDLGRRFLEIRKKKGLPYIDPYTGEVVRPGKG